MTARPIEHCYWVEPGKLLAGEYPRELDDELSREKLANLVDAGVSVFIDLTEPGEATKPYAQMLDGPAHRRFPIRDYSIPESPEFTASILDTIDGYLDAGHTVYVHCWGGIGRTGTIVGCWLARRYGPGPAALARLGELWRENPRSAVTSSPESPEQVSYILEWRE